MRRTHGGRAAAAREQPVRTRPLPPELHPRPGSGARSRSGAGDRNGHEPRRVARLQAHQHGTLLVGTGVGQRLSDVGRCRHRLAADIEDDVAGLEAVVGGAALRIDAGHDHAFASGARHLAGRRERQAEARRVASGAVAFLGAGAGLALLRQLAEGDRQRLRLALAQQRELGGGARRHCADLLGEIAASLTASPFTDVITSPATMPALAAGLSACGSAMSAPSSFLRPRLSAMSAVTGWICTPSHPRVTAPLSLSWATTVFTVAAGIAKAMPTEPPDGE